MLGFSLKTRIRLTVAPNIRLTGKSGEELGDGLKRLGPAGPHAHPDADRNPDQRRKHDQQKDANECVKGQDEDPENLGPVEFGRDILDRQPSRPDGERNDGEDPDPVQKPRGPGLWWNGGRAGAVGKRIGSRANPRSAAKAGRKAIRSQWVRWRRFSTQDVGRILAGRQFDTKFIRPRDDRAEQQLVVQQDDDRHGQNRGADRLPVAGIVGLGDVTNRRRAA